MSLISLRQLSRRDLILKGSKLSLASLAIISGVSTKVFAKESEVSTQDVDVLNVILGTELEGIGAYQIFLEGGLLQTSTARTARLFQGHHKQHRDILAKKIETLGGVPVASKPLDEYKSDLNTVVLATQKDVLNLIARLERSAANAYIGMLPSTNDHELAKMAGRIAADEVTHWATIAALLNLPIPKEALIFGA